MQSTVSTLPAWEDALALAESVYSLTTSSESQWPSTIRDELQRAGIGALTCLFRAHRRTSVHGRPSDVEHAERSLLDLKAVLLLAERHRAPESQSELFDAKRRLQALLDSVRAWLLGAQGDARKQEPHPPGPEPAQSFDFEESTRKHREMMEELRNMGSPADKPKRSWQ